MTKQEQIFLKRTGLYFNQFAINHIIKDAWFIRKYNYNINEDDCQDIIQVALTKIIETIEAYKPELSKIDTWYYNILMNCIKEKHQYHAKYQPISIDKPRDEDGYCYSDIIRDDYCLETDMDKIEEDKIKSEKYYAILVYINSLEPSRYKEIVIAFHLDNLKYDEICSYLDVKIETVKNDLHKFKKNVSKALKHLR